MTPLPRLLAKTCLLLTPLGAVLVSYAALDPFKVLYRYEDYRAVQPAIALNRDYVSTEVFMRHSLEQRYDSFIFGNSRSLAFLCADWVRHIDSQAAFHFDASGESLYGIHGKFRFLHDRGVPLRNVLIILDRGTLGVLDDRDDYMFIKHPAVSGRNWASFHWAFVRAYFAQGFCVRFLAKELLDYDLPFTNPIRGRRIFKVDPVSNDMEFLSEEEAIAREGGAYYAARRHLFPSREETAGTIAWPVVGEGQIQRLKEIKAILESHHTRYKIVVSPLYDQVGLNPADLGELCAIFGSDKVFDFSGVNEFTRPVSNYYEQSHYRMHVAQAILRRIYEGHSSN
jgi:hypothetical protein